MKTSNKNPHHSSSLAVAPAKSAESQIPHSCLRACLRNSSRSRSDLFLKHALKDIGGRIEPVREAESVRDQSGWARLPKSVSDAERSLGFNTRILNRRDARSDCVNNHHIIHPLTIMNAFARNLRLKRTLYCLTALLELASASALAQPIITSQPADKTAVWGDKISFVLGASAPELPSFSWHFNGATLSGRTSSSLVLTNVTFADAGQYFAVVTDLSGSATSRVATLTVPAPVLLNAKVGANIRLGEDPAALPATRRGQTEPHVARSWTDPNLLLATCMDGTIAGGSVDIGYNVSTNGGLTWSSREWLGIPPIDPARPMGAADPVAAIDSSGGLYITSLAAADGMYISKSVDGGQSLLPAQRLFLPIQGIDGMDKEWIAINTFADSPTANRIVVAFTREGNGNKVHCLYSDDGGATWSKPEPIPSAKDSSFVLLNFLPDGSLAALYLRYLNEYLGDANFSQLEFTLSKDGGVSFGPPVVIQDFKGIAYRETLAFNWSVPSMTADRQAGVLYATYPVIIGPATNRVPRVLFTKSIDKGATWTTPIPVNDTPGRRSVSYPTIAVSPDGQHVTVSFYDRRNQTATSADYLYDLYLAESFDAGDTWEPNLRLTEVSSDLHKAPFVDSWRWVGDYQGLVPALNFDVPGVAAWVDTRNGNLDPYAVRIVRTKGTTFEAWRRLRFSTNDLANSTVSGADADPDGDGISNLAEYALGLEPNQSNSGSLKIVATVAGGVSVRYNRLAVLGDIQFSWQTSKDLVHWTLATPAHESVSTGHDPSMQQVEVSFVVAENARFFRLVVDLRQDPLD
jgi:hypothetical protein